MDKFISTGLEGLDKVIKGLRLGDNVVWQVDNIDYYRKFSEYFIQQLLKQGKQLVYICFGQHCPLIRKQDYIRSQNIEICKFNPESGFESFVSQIFREINRRGEGCYYVFDSLSDLLMAWATDLMIGNFFKVICPHLYSLKAVAYFTLLRNRHSYKTVSRIREITQVFIDLYYQRDNYYIYPIKVENRHSATMFLPHVKKEEHLEPITDSYNISNLFFNILPAERDNAERYLDYWDKLFLEAGDLIDIPSKQDEEARMVTRITKIMLARDSKIYKLILKYFELKDLLHIKSRLIGSGFIGGKATGMLLARKILKEEEGPRLEPYLEAHDSFYVGSDVFYSYIVQNGWWELWMKHKQSEHYYNTAQKLKDRFLQGTFPEEIREQFWNMLNYFGQSPIIVRSSSLLEDSYGNAFAGKYDSYFCVNQGDPRERFERFLEAVKKIYASTMSEDALKYRKQRDLQDKEEQMALLIQRVSGEYVNHYFFPLAAGVGFSYNFFTWSDVLNPEAGMLQLVMGLGTRAVNRTEDDYTRIVNLDNVLLKAIKNRQEEREYSQRKLDLLDLESNEFKTRLISEVIAEVNSLKNLEFLGKKDYETLQRVQELNIKQQEPWIINFDNLLTETEFREVMRKILKTLEQAYQYPVDIEFTVNMDEDQNLKINLLQCRPLQTFSVTSDKGNQSSFLPDPEDRHTLFYSKGNFMGFNRQLNIDTVIYIDPINYSRLKQSEQYKIARMVGKLNNRLGNKQDRNILLLAPGRLGSTTPSLGIPVKFSEINYLKVLVEIEFRQNEMIPELSFGSHFYQDLVENRMLYLALFVETGEASFNDNYFNKLPNNCEKFFQKQNEYSKLCDTVKVYEMDTGCLTVYSDLNSRQIAGIVEKDD